jgi:hypothetical protein
MNMELELYLLSLFQCSQVGITAIGDFCLFPKQFPILTNFFLRIEHGGLVNEMPKAAILDIAAMNRNSIIFVDNVTILKICVLRW